MLARAASCDVTPQDRAVRLAGYASRTAPGLDHPRPDRDFRVLLECAGARCTDLQLRSHDRGIRASGQILSKLQPMGFRPDELVLLASHTHWCSCDGPGLRAARNSRNRIRRPCGRSRRKSVLEIQRQQPSQVSLEFFQGRLNHSINRRRYWPFPTLGRTYGLRLTSMSSCTQPVRSQRRGWRRSCCSARPTTDI